MEKRQTRRRALQALPRLQSLEPRTLLSFDLGGSFGTGEVPLAIVAVDFNRDGKHDVAVANRQSNTVSVLLGNGNGTFLPKQDSPVGSVPYAVEAADVNRDGKADLIAANGGDDTVSVLLGNGDGTFQPKADFITGDQPWAVVAADFNRDGKLDLATANYGTGANSASVLLGNGDGTFQTKQDYTAGGLPVCIVAADFNADGNLDLAVANRTTDDVSVLAGVGDGTFLPKQDFTVTDRPTAVNAADVDGNGTPDLTVSTLDDKVSVLLGNGNGTFLPKQDFTAGDSPRSVAVVDVNGDGELDLAVPNSDSDNVSVLLGNGNGTFLPKRDFPVGDQPFAVVTVDLNGDGSADLATAERGSYTVTVLLNDAAPAGTGTFSPKQDFAADDAPNSVTAADINRDGRADLVAANSGTDNLSVLLGNGNGTFLPKQDFGAGDARAVVVADLNRDGKLDLAAADSATDSASLLFGNGDGTFLAYQSLVAGDGPNSLVADDINGDGKLDLALANFDGDSVSVLLGNGDGTFLAKQDFAAGDAPRSITTIDINRDGKLDLVVVNYVANSVSVLLGNGDGMFQAPQAHSVGSGPTALAVADVNGDGKLDLAVTNETDSSVSILLGNGDGAFLPKQDFAVGVLPASVAVADVDGDGALDLAVTNKGANTVSILLGLGDGTFLPKQDVASGASSASVAVMDINGDGKLDLTTANFDSDDVSLLLGIRNKATHFQVDGPVNATAGAPVAVSVLALTAQNMRDCLYSGTVTITSTDAQAQLPADYTFQLADDGEHALSLTLKTVGNQTITIRDAADNSIVGSIVVGVAPAPASAFVVTGFPSSTTAGIEHTFNVTAFDPYGNLATGYTGTVTFSSNDAQAALPANYTFMVGDSGAHSFGTTLKTAGSGSITATDTANATINGTQAGITVNPAAASGLSVSGFPSPVTAGVDSSFTVTARDAFGNTAPGYVGTVQFSCTDPQGILPATYTFTAEDNGSHSFGATLKTAATQTLTATDTNNGTIAGSQNGIIVNAAAADTMLVTGFPSTTTAGVSGSFTVTLKDIYGNIATGYTGTVTFSSTDPQAALPANYTFTAVDNGSHAFSATLKTAGTHGLTAVDTGNGALTATQSGIVVSAAAHDRFLVWTYPMPMTAGAASTFQVTAKDAYGNTTTSYTGSVGFSSSDTQAMLPANYTFTPGDNGISFFSFTMKTAGTQSLTATDTVNPAITGTKTGITVVHAYAASYTLIPSVTKISVGKPMSVTVTVRDPYGNVVNDYVGIVHFTSTDTIAVLPPDYTFTTSDNGTKLFGNAITFHTPGSQTVTATDTIDNAITGNFTILVSKKAHAPLIIHPVTPVPPPPAPIGDDGTPDSIGNRPDATVYNQAHQGVFESPPRGRGHKYASPSTTLVRRGLPGVSPAGSEAYLPKLDAADSTPVK